MEEILELILAVKKSKVMIVNRSEDERDATWRLGVNELQQVCEYK